MHQEAKTPKDYVLAGLAQEAAELRQRWQVTPLAQSIYPATPPAYVRYHNHQYAMKQSNQQSR